MNQESLGCRGRMVSRSPGPLKGISSGGVRELLEWGEVGEDPLKYGGRVNKDHPNLIQLKVQSSSACLRPQRDPVEGDSTSRS